MFKLQFIQMLRVSKVSEKETIFIKCINLLKAAITNDHTNRDVLFHSSGDEKSKIDIPA